MDSLNLEFAYSQEAGLRLEMYFDFSNLVMICCEELRDELAIAEYYESLAENGGD